MHRRQGHNVSIQHVSRKAIQKSHLLDGDPEPLGESSTTWSVYIRELGVQPALRTVAAAGSYQLSKCSNSFKRKYSSMLSNQKKPR
jgi:hypothetical protein